MNVGTQVIQMNTVVRLNAPPYSAQNGWRRVHSQLLVAYGDRVQCECVFYIYFLLVQHKLIVLFFRY